MPLPDVPVSFDEQDNDRDDDRQVHLGHETEASGFGGKFKSLHTRKIDNRHILRNYKICFIKNEVPFWTESISYYQVGAVLCLHIV